MTDEVGSWDAAVAAVRAGAAPAEAAAGLVEQMEDQERLECLHGALPFWAGLTDLGTGGYHRRPFLAAAVPRLGIPGFAFSDGPRGVVIGNATCFPVSMARGGAWDVDLEERIGDAIGQELRAMGADLYGGVCVNVLRHPAWGRAQETYGEDPHHVGELGAALTRGVQGHVMACVKHLACNSMENARFTVDVAVDDEALHEVFLPHFRRIVDEGVACVMSAYNQINGEWSGDSPALLTSVLRDEWGFEGFVISDWFFGLRDAATSVRAGLDVEMPSPMIRRGAMEAALADGELTWDHIDARVIHTMTALLRYSATPGAQQPVPSRDVLACPEHRALAREAAAKSLVLLRNEPVDRHPLLPLAEADLQDVVVIGELADAWNPGDGGSSDVWAPSLATPLDGIRSALPDATVRHDAGDDIARAADAARTADVAIVVVGYTRADEGEFIGASGTSHLGPLFPGPDDPDEVATFLSRIEAEGPPLQAPDAEIPGSVGGFSEGGDRRSLRLHDHHEQLIRAVAAANPRTIVVVVAGSAVVMEAWRHEVPAIVLAWYSGMEGGHALADVLLGRVDATGRLPFSIPTDEEHLPDFDPDAGTVTYDAWHGYWKLERDGHAPAYPFGFGLSYTSWELALGDSEGPGDAGQVKLHVTNTGERDGTTVVQAYLRRPGRPERRLVGFVRLDVPRGVTAWGGIPIDRRTLEIRTGGGWQTPEGTYELSVGLHAGHDAGAFTFTV